ncbi:MAG: T9SS type A sorting domain-containing protein, partial [Ignavibacteria bacterium]|nr:T9SS type A sorting domain-containing protein [Ignavibacteria bacterium]
GAYEVEWNAIDIPSGVYFYQLKTGEYVDTKKMILLR